LFRASVQRSFYDFATAPQFRKCTQECVRDFIAHLKNRNATEFLDKQTITRKHTNLANFELRRKSLSNETPNTLTSQALILGMTSFQNLHVTPSRAELSRLRVLLQHVLADAVGLPLVADRPRPRAV
jgi:hypothetical protein